MHPQFLFPPPNETLPNLQSSHVFAGGVSPPILRNSHFGFVREMVSFICLFFSIGTRKSAFSFLIVVFASPFFRPMFLFSQVPPHQPRAFAGFTFASWHPKPRKTTENKIFRDFRHIFKTPCFSSNEGIVRYVREGLGRKKCTDFLSRLIFFPQKKDMFFSEKI